MTRDPLLYPELLREIPILGGLAEAKMAQRVVDAVEDPRTQTPYSDLKYPKVSIVIRTLNESRALFWLLDDIDQQVASPDTEIIVVDNESSDNTVSVAKEFGATVVSLAREDFSYPRSMNVGVEAASNDLVFLTVGHAKLSNRFLLAGAARHFEETDMGGVFARFQLPAVGASRTEKYAAAAGILPALRPAREVTKTSMGLLAATNCLIRKETWKDLCGFDEAYALGGEDGDMGKRMLKEGLALIEDPVASVHHSHRLGPINMLRQVCRWQKTAKPQPFDQAAIAKSRPDLNFSR